MFSIYQYLILEKKYHNDVCNAAAENYYTTQK